MIVLDTHTLLWWAAGDKAQLSTKALEAIEAELDGGHMMIRPLQ